MVQLPVERERIERGMRKIEGGGDIGGRGQALPAAKCNIALAEDGLEVTGYPFAINRHPAHRPPPSAPGLKNPFPALLCQPSAFLP